MAEDRELDGRHAAVRAAHDAWLSEDDADAVVWLDHPRRVVMARVVRRTLWRGLIRQELWHGNRESLADLRHREPEQNIVRWAWTTHPRVTERYAAQADDPRMVRLRGPRAAEAWLRRVEAGSRPHG